MSLLVRTAPCCAARMSLFTFILLVLVQLLLKAPNPRAPPPPKCRWFTLTVVSQLHFSEMVVYSPKAAPFFSRLSSRGRVECAA